MTTTLTINEKKQVDKIYTKLVKKSIKYGNTNKNRIFDPCLRVRNMTNHKIKNRTWKSYGVGFMKEYGYLPTTDNKLEISHICGQPKSKLSKCIQGSHMKLELQNVNKKRKKCHQYIRKYVNKFKPQPNRHNEYQHVTRTKGSLTVKQINEILRKINKKIDMKKPRHKCTHYKNPCFINFGEIPKPRTSKRIAALKSRSLNK